MSTSNDDQEYMVSIRKHSKVYGIATIASIILLVLSFKFRPSGWLWYIFNPFEFLLLSLTFLMLYFFTKYTSRYYAKRNEILTLFRQWEKETFYLSGNRETHYLHKEIVSRGRWAVKFLLEELKNRKCHVFTMLGEITGENPILKEHRGNIRAMRQDWLAWGKKNGYI